MMRSVKEYIESGGHSCAECGGMLYLCRMITDMDGNVFRMADVLNMDATFRNMKLHLGYRRLEIKENDLPCIDCKEMYGHEFHYSDIENISTDVVCTESQYTAKGKKTDTKLFRYKNLIAGYTHFYWGNL